MKSFIRILTWLLVMAVLTLIGIALWAVVFDNSQSVTSLKWLQFIQTVCTFLLPPVVCAWYWDEHRRPLAWLLMDSPVPWQTFVWAVAIMLCALPGINLLADLNSRIQLPESLASIEQMLQQMESAAEHLLQSFLQTDSAGGIAVNLGLMALLPALAEELSFRGTMQQILSNSQFKIHNSKIQNSKIHIAIWVTAFVFSAIHMQFYGFIPRMLMGALFGYMFVWTGSLWVPIVMHFTNNAVAVAAYYILPDTKTADTFGAGDQWFIGVISLVAVGALLWAFTSPDQPECDRRTRTQ